MKKNKITVIINKPIEEVFEFTLNPKNTPLWIQTIKEEISDSFPAKIGTIYKNRGISGVWNCYTVVELKKNKSFTMRAWDNNYLVRYTFKKLGEAETKLVYFERVEKGELNNPFTAEVLQKLKEVMENLEI